MKLNIFIKSILLILFLNNPSFANVAMPGFFNTGGNTDFTPLNKDHYVLIQNIQMKSELIKVDLYKGFAVVKAEYDMLNNTDKEINIKASFPKNSFYKNKIHVSFDTLYNLRVTTNNITQPTVEKEKWFEWDIKFIPNSITKIFIYYMVNTNNAVLREGYDRSQDNGFTYILETGKIWKNKIESGNIYIKLMDNLSINDIYGVLPENVKYKDNLLLYSFNNLEPEPSNNLVIRYKKYNENFNFTNYLLNYKKYYDDIDKAQYTQLTNDFIKINKNDFSPPNYSSLFFLVVILVICLIIFLPSIIIVIFIIKKLRKKK